MPSSPMLVATAQATALSGASNIAAQIIGIYQARRPSTFDLIQFARFVLLTVVTAPPNYQWQHFLEKALPAYVGSSPASPGMHSGQDVEKEGVKQDGLTDQARSKPRLNMRNTLTKWFVDCMTLGAIVNVAAFLILMGLMKGESLELIGQNIRTETIPIMVAGYKIWPIASILSFSFVPVEKRLVFLSFVGFLWGIYMSLVAAEI